MPRRTGIYIEPRESQWPLAMCVERAELAERLGFDSIWMSQIVDAEDAGVLLTAYAARTSRIGLGVAVIPIYLRHPVATVQLAATLDAYSGGRFRLGLGAASQLTIEWILGQRSLPPLDSMREYVSIVRAGLGEGQVSLRGKHFSARWKYAASPRPMVPIMIGAMGPRMAELAGEIADGVALWLSSPAYVADVIRPGVRRGCERAGRGLDGFEVQACLYVSLTANEAAARDMLRPLLQHYSQLPTYRKVFDAMGFKSELDRGVVSDALVDQLAAIGDEVTIRGRLEELREAGCTLPALAVIPEHEGSADFATTIQAAISA